MELENNAERAERAMIPFIPTPLPRTGPKYILKATVPEQLITPTPTEIKPLFTLNLSSYLKTKEHRSI